MERDIDLSETLEDHVRQIARDSAYFVAWLDLLNYICEGEDLIDGRHTVTFHIETPNGVCDKELPVSGHDIYYLADNLAERYSEYVVDYAAHMLKSVEDTTSDTQKEEK